MKIQKLITDIKKKREFSSLPDSFVLEVLEKYLSRIKTKKLKPSEEKMIVKEVRAELRRSIGMFQKGSKNREVFFKKGNIQKLLKTHSSTLERIGFYPNFKKIISEINPSSILDLGCGLNPIALANKKTTYYAVDIREDELNLIKKFFKKNKIQGRVFLQDLRKPINNLPYADLCLILKLFDVLTKDKGHIEYLIKNLKCKTLIVSFSTKTLSGKQMRFHRRLWLERILKRLNYEFSIEISDNEIFYIIKKLRSS